MSCKCRGFLGRRLYSLLAQMSMEKKLLLPRLPVVLARLNTVMSYHKLTGHSGEMYTSMLLYESLIF